MRMKRASTRPPDTQLGPVAPTGPDGTQYIEHVGTRRVVSVGDAHTIIVRPRISTWYKLLLGASLGLNALILLLLLTVGADAYRFYRAFSAEVSSLAGAPPAAERLAALREDPAAAADFAVDTARRTVGETLAAVREIEQATINANVPIDRALPLQLDVPIASDTVVTTNAPVPLVVPASITFPAGGGNLNATVALNLPAGMQLPVRLDLSVPLSTTVPVKFDVPVSIPLRDTELASPFARLRRLLEPAAQFFESSAP